MPRRSLSSRSIVLIFDEVMTSRLAPGGLSSLLGIEPDLKTLGKYIGGGMSFGAFGGRRAIMEQFDPRKANALPHAGTFNNNTLTMRAGLVGLSGVFTPEACRELNARGDRLRAALNALFMRYQVRMQATGIGSMLSLHPQAGTIARPEDAAAADRRLRQLLFHDLLDQGIYMAERGFIAVSLMVSEKDCGRLLEAVEGFIMARREFLVSREAVTA